MINIMLKKNGAYFSFVIENKKITGIIKGISLPYQPANLIEVRTKILSSRNKLPKWLEEVFTLTKSEQEEFNNAKDELALKEIVIKDAKKQQCEIIKIE
jgi:hypothetical protein